VTLGADGAALYESGRSRLHIPAPRVQPVDTTRAGDAFCGALATALSASHSRLQSAGRYKGTLLSGAQLPIDFAPPQLTPAGRL
jgi:sugar/nucleoside kinase (ribokinase family)